MSSAEALKTFFTILGVIVAIPMVLVMVKVGMFFGSLAGSVKALEQAATTFTAKVDRVLEKLVDRVDDHEVRIALTEQFVDAQKIDLGWAPDRRQERRPPLSDELRERKD